MFWTNISCRVLPLFCVQFFNRSNVGSSDRKKEKCDLIKYFIKHFFDYYKTVFLPF